MAVAVIGSRRCSRYGREQAGRMASDLAGMGFTVVSGMARGIDDAAHRGALSAAGRTIAVLGCGLGHLLSREAAELAGGIADCGALISELPMEAAPRPGNFPPRNRLISGLSLGTVVVEAALRSGSLITARLAGEQGRTVFAVPGSVASPTSRGCHRLIRDGAILVENARDVVDALGPLAEPIAMRGPADRDGEANEVADPRVLSLSERERRVYDLLDQCPMQIDRIVAETGLPPSIVSSTVLTMEVRGLVRQLPGQHYVRR
jgi:DNA processing protein